MWKDLAEHTGALVAVLSTLALLVGAFASIAWAIFWRLICRIDDKTDKIGECVVAIMSTCGSREAECLRNFVTQKEFDEWKAGRDGPGGLWAAINHHKHDPNGRTIR